MATPEQHLIWALDRFTRTVDETIHSVAMERSAAYRRAIRSALPAAPTIDLCRHEFLAGKTGSERATDARKFKSRYPSRADYAEAHTDFIQSIINNK